MGSGLTCPRGGAQRLSASEMVSPHCLFDVAKAKSVLNAFRHRRWFRRLIFSDHFGGTVVLNAFRHRRWFRWEKTGKTCQLKLSAQRLSASEMVSLGMVAAEALHGQCSTPFGIGDGFARRSKSRPVASSGAQRLSASEMVSPAWSRARSTMKSGAQRLSASEMVSQNELSDYPSDAQLCSTPFGIGDGFARILRSLPLSPVGCSTPFGIGDGFAL